MDAGEALEFLKDHDLTQEQMDEIWIQAGADNWKVQLLAKVGKHWYDCNRVALETLPAIRAIKEGK